MADGLRGPLDGVAYFHVGIGVENLDEACAVLGAGLGLTWVTEVRPTILGWPLRIALSAEGPPYYELIEAPVGSPWVPRSGEGMTHLGFWSDDPDADRQALCSAGYSVGVDGFSGGYPFVYLRPPLGGPWIELTATANDRLWAHHRAVVQERVLAGTEAAGPPP